MAIGSSQHLPSSAGAVSDVPGSARTARRRDASAKGGASNSRVDNPVLPMTDHRPRLRRNGSARSRRILITGGAGFVGTNLAKKWLDEGHRVIVLDNLSRPGVEDNVEWLTRHYGDAVDVRLADVRDGQAVRRAVQVADRIYHFAAQVAVTTSLVDPLTDFAVNAQGMLNILEAVRAQATPPPLLFTSTNKVYGDLGQTRFVERALRYEPVARRLREFGISESQPLDFHSPYGCSKGTADQYMLDYARCYRLPTVVFRMSCIYGPHQWGTEDQGWVAHFLLQALRDEPITIYGDGKQVRDILFVEDLVRAMCMAHDQIEVTHGRAFNIGGGPARTISLLELIDAIEVMRRRPVHVRFESSRQGDQRFYVSDIRGFSGLTGWQPETSVQSGIRQLFDWLKDNRLDGDPYLSAPTRFTGLSQLQQATISIEKAR